MAEGKARRMWALPGAVFVVPQSSLMVGGSDEIIEVPVPSFLIEHPRGLVLYDTGSHPRVAEDVASYWGEMFRNMVRFSNRVFHGTASLAFGGPTAPTRITASSAGLTAR